MTLRRLVNQIDEQSTPHELAKILEQYHGKVYGRIDRTTALSAIHLAEAEASAIDSDNLAQIFITKLNTHRSEIETERSQCPACAPNDGRFYRTDIVKFCRELRKGTTNQQIKDATERVLFRHYKIANADKVQLINAEI